MLNLSIETWLGFLVWPVIGLAVYACYGYRHSRVRSTAAGPAGREAVAERR
jgi:basic amino acid/polyamine antiporter, APA family